MVNKVRDRQIADIALRCHRFRPATGTLEARDDDAGRVHSVESAAVRQDGSQATTMHELATAVLFRDDAPVGGRHLSRQMNISFCIVYRD